MTKEEKIAQIQNMRLLDDALMQRVFDGQPRVVEEILRPVLKRDLTVSDVKAQETVTSTYGHSVRFDVFAEDSEGKCYDIEIQNAKEGAIAQRARYNSAMLDNFKFEEGEDYSNLKESYVIFFTETDVLGGGLGLYHIDRAVSETGEPFGDGAHIIYVNCAYESDDEVGRLAEDFRRRTLAYNSSVLGERVNVFKDNGGKYMVEWIESWFQEELAEKTKELAEKTKELTEKTKELQSELDEKDAEIVEKTIQAVLSLQAQGVSEEIISKALELSIEEVESIINAAS